jgi:adenosine deaminase/aminodeoxyfutalosine deaminase
VDECKNVVKIAIALRDHQIRKAGSSSIVGIGIGGDERRAGADQFAAVYKYAKAQGLRLTAHAGETVGPESIWSALNIGTERIGHGLHAMEDAELVEVLAERQIPIEACISSNVRTGCCGGFEHHPVRAMFDSGLMVTLNTDDPPMFQTDILAEYKIAHEQFDFTRDQLRELARNSFEASFLPAEKKLEFLGMLDRA